MFSDGRRLVTATKKRFSRNKHKTSTFLFRQVCDSPLRLLSHASLSLDAVEENITLDFSEAYLYLPHSLHDMAVHVFVSLLSVMDLLTEQVKQATPVLPYLKSEREPALARFEGPCNSP